MGIPILETPGTSSLTAVECVAGASLHPHRDAQAIVDDPHVAAKAASLRRSCHRIVQRPTLQPPSLRPKLRLSSLRPMLQPPC